MGRLDFMISQPPVPWLREGWGGLPIIRALAPALLMPPTLALFWTPYADWIYTVVSTTGLLLIVWLVLRPRG